jgi:hypothetical protein
MAIPLLSKEGQPRSGGVVCSKSARSALLRDGREAHRFIRSASIYRASIRTLRNFEQTAARAYPPNLGGE